MNKDPNRAAFGFRDSTIGRPRPLSERLDAVRPHIRGILGKHATNVFQGPPEWDNIVPDWMDFKNYNKWPNR
jgi:hypothetical protein